MILILQDEKQIQLAFKKINELQEKIIKKADSIDGAKEYIKNQMEFFKSKQSEYAQHVIMQK
jgi:hypothetical protein